MFGVRLERRVLKNCQRFWMAEEEEEPPVEEIQSEPAEMEEEEEAPGELAAANAPATAEEEEASGEWTNSEPAATGHERPHAQIEALDAKREEEPANAGTPQPLEGDASGEKSPGDSPPSPPTATEHPLDSRRNAALWYSLWFLLPSLLGIMLDLFSRPFRGDL
jgi:hypothetical protein